MCVYVLWPLPHALCVKQGTDCRLLLNILEQREFEECTFNEESQCGEKEKKMIKQEYIIHTLALAQTKLYNLLTQRHTYCMVRNHHVQWLSAASQQLQILERAQAIFF